MNILDKIDNLLTEAAIIRKGKNSKGKEFRVKAMGQLAVCEIKLPNGKWWSAGGFGKPRNQAIEEYERKISE